MTIGTSSQKMFSTTKCAVSRSTTKDGLCDRQKQKPKTHMVGGRIPPEMHLPKPPVYSLRPTLVHMEPCFPKGAFHNGAGNGTASLRSLRRHTTRGSADASLVWTLVAVPKFQQCRSLAVEHINEPNDTTWLDSHPATKRFTGVG